MISNSQTQKVHNILVIAYSINPNSLFLTNIYLFNWIHRGFLTIAINFTIYITYLKTIYLKIIIKVS